MNTIIYVIGFIYEKLKSCGVKYKCYKNNKSVKNSGGRISGLVSLRFPNNIIIGTRSYINSGVLSASENAKIV